MLSLIANAEPCSDHDPQPAESVCLSEARREPRGETLARSNGSPEPSASVQDRKGTTSGNSRLWRRARQRPQAGTRSIYPAKDQLALNSPRPRLRSLAAVSVSSIVASNVLCNHSTSAKATAPFSSGQFFRPQSEPLAVRAWWELVLRRDPAVPAYPPEAALGSSR